MANHKWVVERKDFGSFIVYPDWTIIEVFSSKELCERFLSVKSGLEFCFILDGDYYYAYLRTLVVEVELPSCGYRVRKLY